jgi:hypothetical protein
MMIIIIEKDLKGNIVYEVGGGLDGGGVYRLLEPKKFVTVTLRWTRESVSWSIPRDLSSRIPGCAGSNPASRIFFCLCSSVGRACGC